MEVVAAAERLSDPSEALAEILLVAPQGRTLLVRDRPADCGRTTLDRSQQLHHDALDGLSFMSLSWCEDTESSATVSSAPSTTPSKRKTMPSV